jgi:hypothetical protein
MSKKQFLPVLVSTIIGHHQEVKPFLAPIKLVTFEGHPLLAYI